MTDFRLILLDHTTYVVTEIGIDLLQLTLTMQLLEVSGIARGGCNMFYHKAVIFLAWNNKFVGAMRAFLQF